MGARSTKEKTKAMVAATPSGATPLGTPAVHKSANMTTLLPDGGLVLAPDHSSTAIAIALTASKSVAGLTGSRVALKKILLFDT